jgi:hypothetical protein
VSQARNLHALVWSLSSMLAFALGLPAISWEPLHLDEAIMLRFSTRSPAEIITDVFVERGGAPLQFLVEHLTLQWPGGLVGLRLPSLCFFALAIVFSGLFTLELFGEREALIVPPVLAASPMAVELGTFARMYALFLCVSLAAGWLALVAGRTGSRRGWLAAGILVGGLVYVHPIAPLTCAAIIAGPFLVDERPLRAAFRTAWPGLAVAGALAAPYLYALTVLRARYGVGESGLLTTTEGRSVAEEALHAFTPGGITGVLFFSAAATFGLVLLADAAPRRALAAGLWIALPVIFFTVVPAETRFFGRYVIPALPAFLGLVVVGVLGLARRRRIVAVAALAAAVAMEATDDVRRIERLNAVDLPRLPVPAKETVLFSSTGTPVSGRPPELLDDLVALQRGDGERLEELPAIDPRFDSHVIANGAANVGRFLTKRTPARAMWIFHGRPDRVRAARRRLSKRRDVRTRLVSAQLLVVETRREEDRRRLVELAIAVRSAWGLRTPSDRWPRAIVSADRAGLRSAASAQADSLDNER